MLRKLSFAERFSTKNALFASRVWSGMFEYDDCAEILRAANAQGARDTGLFSGLRYESI